MRKRLLTTTIFMALLLALASLPAFAGNKVDVCHRPPGNPDNFHTISVSENALQAHLKERLAVYKRPKHILQFTPDELAFTANAKLQVGELKERAIARLEAENVTIEDVTYKPAPAEE